MLIFAFAIISIRIYGRQSQSPNIYTSLEFDDSVFVLSNDHNLGLQW